ncbi:phosphatidylglycerophosphatase B [Rahnella victoriana]|uniref:undecaprenyl-diphosphate phosphatase n=1 Tax=Rahnella victoriana TaxID=1510570 RepID=A0ABS0DNC2_9GAMM|nr:phosphatidylglycerophosphatase B [Rahnella victoriana]MBF7955381.1 phosphatidylglycerophosphatase B [Rahnella victoriana]TBX35382.1 phosphatidylglycerophosphatase B [Rahnella victoriana]UHM90546.1 phosphatidylglycerophosphatase B [Rahnella victoriana]
MYDIAKRTAIGAVMLLVMPAAVWISGWLWTPGGNPAVLRPLYWVTETVSQPWGIITTVVLCGWFLWCLRFRLKAASGLVAIIIAALLIGQYAKDYIKSEVREPRPYVAWLGTDHQMNVDEFYAQKRKARSAQVKEILGDNVQVPHWLNKSWQKDTGYAFPSGHTMFAATWALLGVGLLWRRKHYKTVTVLMIWGVVVMGSRLMLGMHWPRDLVASVGISWLLVTVACWLTQRYIGPLTPPPAENREIEERDPS